MGINNLNEVSQGDLLQPADSNQHRSALIADLVPRNSAGVPESEAGSLGTEALEWKDVFAKRLFSDGVQLTPSGGGVNTGRQLRTGIKSGIAPTNSPRASGWMRPAGAAGITLIASAANPLVAVVDGVQHSLEESLTGGSNLPDSLSLAAMLVGADWNRQSIAHCTGYNFINSSSPAGVPLQYGDNQIFMYQNSASQTGYIIGQRSSDLDNFRRFSKLGNYCSMISSTTTSEYNCTVPDSPDQISTFVRTGFIFADPTLPAWEIHIEKRIVGSVNQALPISGSYEAGDMIWRENEFRWYRHSGTAWVRTNRVYLGLAAVHDNIVGAVAPVRTEEDTLELCHAHRDLILNFKLGDPLDSECILRPTYDSSTQTISFAALDHVHSQVERKNWTSLSSQTPDTYAPAPTLDLSGLSLADETLYLVYADALTHELSIDVVPPQLLVLGEVPMYVHPNKSSLLVSSFAVGENGSIWVDGSVPEVPASPSGDLYTFFPKGFVWSFFEIDLKFMRVQYSSSVSSGLNGPIHLLDVDGNRVNDSIGWIITDSGTAQTVRTGSLNIIAYQIAVRYYYAGGSGGVNQARLDGLSLAMESVVPTIKMLRDDILTEFGGDGGHAQ